MTFHLIDYIFILIKLLTGFAIVIGYYNISGRGAQFTQMNGVDMLGNYIFGGVIGGVLYNTQIPFYIYVIELLLSALVLFFISTLYQKLDMFRSVTVGTTIPIIRNGRFLIKNIEENEKKVDLLNISSQLNLKGIFSFDDIAYAQIEPNGSLTVTCDPSCIPAPIVCSRGYIRESVFDEIKKTPDDFKKDMKEYGINSTDQILLAEYRVDSTGTGHFHYVCTNGEVLPHSDRIKAEEKQRQEAEQDAEKQKEEK